MPADPVRRLREEPARRGRPGSLVCTLAGPDGQTIGTLTIDLEPVSGHPEPDADPLRLGTAMLSGEGPDPGELRLRLPASWTERGRPELAIHAVLVHDGPTAEDHAGGHLPARDVPGGTRAPLADLVAGYERTLIEDALRSTYGNRARAAKLLQTTERILGYRIQQYGIDCAQFRKRNRE